MGAGDAVAPMLSQRKLGIDDLERVLSTAHGLTRDMVAITEREIEPVRD